MITVKVSGLDELQRKARALEPELRLEFRKALMASGGVVRDEAAARIHSPGGHAAKGLGVKFSRDMSVKIGPFGKGGTGRAAVFAQRNRGPGRTPPPMKAARAMARRYGLPPSAARGIALAIARRGTVGTPVMAASLAAVRDQVVVMFREAFIRAARRTFGQ